VTSSSSARLPGPVAHSGRLERDPGARARPLPRPGGPRRAHARDLAVRPRDARAPGQVLHVGGASSPTRLPAAFARGGGNRHLHKSRLMRPNPLRLRYLRTRHRVLCNATDARGVTGPNPDDRVDDRSHARDAARCLRPTSKQTLESALPERFPVPTRSTPGSTQARAEPIRYRRAQLVYHRFELRDPSCQILSWSEASLGQPAYP
jgi:hypothetical protein